MLRGYFDESGTHFKHEGVFTLAGYVASGREWRLFTRKWQQTLARSGFNSLPSTERPGRFHTEPFMHDRTWPEDRKNQLLSQLATVINTRVSFGCAFSTRVRDYEEVFVEPAGDAPRRWDFRKPNVWGLQGCMQDIWNNQHLLKRMPGEKVACMFDRNVEFDAPARRNFQYWAGLARWGQIFGTIEFDQDDSMVPLDAADLLAYATNWELRNRERGVGKRAQFLEPLLNSPRVRLHLHYKPTLLEARSLMIADAKATGLLDEAGERTDKPLPELPKAKRK